MTTQSSGAVLADWCETPCGYAYIVCSSKGVQNVDLFDEGRLLERHIRYHESRSVQQTVGAPRDLKDMLQRVMRAVSRQSAVESIPLDLSATRFQLSVWQHLRSIPCGQVRTYSEVACAIQMPTAARAVANACASNPVGLLIPCHRVVRSDGSLGGYRWGRQLKEHLLTWERRTKTQRACLSGLRPIG